jgi:hypothetical protein
MTLHVAKRLMFVGGSGGQPVLWECKEDVGFGFKEEETLEGSLVHKEIFNENIMRNSKKRKVSRMLLVSILLNDLQILLIHF